MVNYMDISRFGYPYSTVGAFASPAVTGGIGASNPVGAYMQNVVTPTSVAASYNPTGLGGVTVDPWKGLREEDVVGGVGNTGIDENALGLNIPTFRLALGGLQTIGNLWNAWQANKLARDQFNFSKDFALNNLTNQIQSYNTALEDRARSRYHTEGGSQEDAERYIEQNRLYRTI